MISFGLTYLRSDGILFALGLMGLAYGIFSLGFGTVLFLRWRRKHRGWFRLLLLPFILLCLLCVVGFISMTEAGFSSFNPLHVYGVFGFSLAILFGVGGLHSSYTASYKMCPDCAETVLAKANVCKHCGFRWAQLSVQPETD